VGPVVDQKQIYYSRKDDPVTEVDLSLLRLVLLDDDVLMHGH
jgi:hypothetical protein